MGDGYTYYYHMKMHVVVEGNVGVGRVMVREVWIIGVGYAHRVVWWGVVVDWGGWECAW